MGECGTKESIKKRHRYIPTQYEYLIQYMKEEKYNYCLECGKKMEITKE